MKQQGNAIHPGNIQHFADSAANAIQLGQRQFFTPPDLAAAFCSVFQNNCATIATDLMVGSGHLLTAAKRSHSLGIDVDERISHSKFKIQNSKFIGCQADVTRWYPLAHAAGLDHDLLLLNPPFSLQWYLDRLAPLALSSALGVKETYAAALAKGPTIDSTLGALLIALDLLTSCGEGFMICNADTARRLLGDPEGKTADAKGLFKGRDATLPDAPIGRRLLPNVWCWLDVPGAIYENQHSAFPTAVLYFSASHGHAVPKDRLPLYLHAPSADPSTVERTLATAVSARSFGFCGRSVNYDRIAQSWEDDVKPLWDAVRQEYHALYHGAAPAWNLMLSASGKIATHLDPFRRAAYTHDRALLTAFKSMSGESPAALVVQQTTRAALKHAMVSGAWRVQPELIAAVDAAIASYESIRAPFYTPEETQSLGWLDEENSIQCKSGGIPGFCPGIHYELKTWIEDTSWNDTKKNLIGEVEKIELSGRELVIELTDDHQTRHQFHLRHLDGEIEDKGSVRHHHLNALLKNFAIPIPMDVAQANPAAYQANLARLDLLEEMINA